MNRRASWPEAIYLSVPCSPAETGDNPHAFACCLSLQFAALLCHTEARLNALAWRSCSLTYCPRMGLHDWSAG